MIIEHFKTRLYHVTAGTGKHLEESRLLLITEQIHRASHRAVLKDRISTILSLKNFTA